MASLTPLPNRSRCSDIELESFLGRANFPVLSQLCRHIIAARQVAQMIKAYSKKKDFNYRDYAELLKQQAAESLSIMRLSRSLRLTQQSTFDHKRRLPGGGAVVGNPWDREE